MTAYCCVLRLFTSHIAALRLHCRVLSLSGSLRSFSSQIRLHFILYSIQRQLHSPFHSGLSTQWQLVLALSTFTILFFPYRHLVAAYVFFTSFRPFNLFLQLRIWEGARVGIVVKTLHYKPAGRRFDSRCWHWDFSVTLSFRSHYGPRVDSASNSNGYQVCFLGVKAAGA
jgi:hypothetical protein